MTTKQRRPAHVSEELETPPPAPPGASDATLYIFLAAVILLLVTCIAFVLIAS